jgi:hypothetical protein
MSTMRYPLARYAQGTDQPTGESLNNFISIQWQTAEQPLTDFPSKKTTHPSYSECPGPDKAELPSAQGDRFHLVSAIAEVYNNKIESIHIGSEAVTEGHIGHMGQMDQMVGMSITDSNRAKLGDWVECHTIARSREILPRHPKPGITWIAA